MSGGWATKLKNKRYHSFFRLLLENYIIFTILIAVVLFVLFGAGLYYEGAQYEKINPSVILRFSEALTHGDYSSINVERVLGKGGYIAILDSKGKLVYNSDKSRTIPEYTMSELELIEEYDGNKYLQTYKIESEGQTLFCVITTEFMNDRFATTKIMVANENLDIVYQSPDTGKKR